MTVLVPQASPATRSAVESRVGADLLPDVVDYGATSAAELELSIVMPCLNEVETVGLCVGKAMRFLHENRVSGEVILADNGSTDGSQSLAEQLGARVVSVAEKGYGAALMGGILAARSVYVILGDSDDSYDFTNLMPYVKKLRQGNDLVMGNRFRGGIERGAMPPLHRYFGNPVLTGIGRLFFESRCGDFHCGLRGLSRAAALRMDLRTTGMEFASEMVVKAALLNMKVAEVPTVLSPDGRSRPPHLRSWRDGWRHLRFLMMYCPRWLFFYPGLMLMSLGLMVMLWLLPGARHVGSVALDVHTLLYAGLALVVGFQAVIFSILTKVYGVAEGFLPRDVRLEKMFRVVTLETGLAAGVVLCVVGLSGAVFAVWDWSRRSFGDVEPTSMLRLVVPSAVCLTLGCQTVLSSFFLSILGIRRR
ncbi:MAG: glycosyltransferase family 2 protein, partial [Acidobacteria bacterium]